MPESEWQILYKAALNESDPRRLYSRIEAAKRAIRDRIDRLDTSSGDTRERELLDRALHALFTLPARKRSA